MSWTAAHGQIAIVPSVPDIALAADFVSGGINDAGVTCDQQTLVHTKYAPRSHTSRDLSVNFFCNWVLGNFGSVHEVREGLADINVYNGIIKVGGSHFSVRDAFGSALIIEFIDGATQMYNDTLGLMTNEPPYPFHQANVKHLAWKEHLARPAVAIPGSFYPDERLLRLHMLRDGLLPGLSHRQQLMNAAALLDSVTVPPGAQPGTDTGASSGEGTSGDHTHFGIIYDHTNLTMYWRTRHNHNLQRLRLADAHLDEGEPSRHLPLNADNGLAWFSDAAEALRK